MIAKEPLPHPHLLGCLFWFQDQGQPIALTHRAFTSGPCPPWDLMSSHPLPPHLPPCCAQPLELSVFAQRNLCTGLCVCLECPTSSPSFGESLLPFRTNSNVSSSKVFLDCLGRESSFLCSDAAQSCA